MKVAVVEYPRVVSLRKWCEIVQVKESLGYELSRFDRIPGQFRVGRQVRVNLDVYFEQTKASQSNTPKTKGSPATTDEGEKPMLPRKVYR